MSDDDFDEALEALLLLGGPARKKQGTAMHSYVHSLRHARRMGADVASAAQEAHDALDRAGLC